MDLESLNATFVIDTFLLLLIGIGPKIALVPFLELTQQMSEATKRQVLRKIENPLGDEQTADEADYFHAVTSPTPYVLVFVLGLSFLLLMLAFRSLTIAVVSILLNLLSAGAASPNDPVTAGLA